MIVNGAKVYTSRHALPAAHDLIRMLKELSSVSVTPGEIEKLNMGPENDLFRTTLRDSIERANSISQQISRTLGTNEGAARQGADGQGQGKRDFKRNTEGFATEAEKAKYAGPGFMCNTLEVGKGNFTQKCATLANPRKVKVNKCVDPGNLKQCSMNEFNKYKETDLLTEEEYKRREVEAPREATLHAKQEAQENQQRGRGTGTLLLTPEEED